MALVIPLCRILVLFHDDRDEVVVFGNGHGDGRYTLLGIIEVLSEQLSSSFGVTGKCLFPGNESGSGRPALC